jgi:hypothetical protein
MMDSDSDKPSLRKTSLRRRVLPRTSVLWTGIVCETNGANAFDCTIRNISDGGAAIGAKKTTAVGDQAFLLVTRSQLAYLSSVAWVQSERFGLSFSQVYEVGPKLPSELKFLRYLLAQTKLRQMLGFVQRGIPLDEAARVVGWTDDEIEQLSDVTSTDQNADFLMQQTRRLFKT